MIYFSVQDFPRNTIATTRYCYYCGLEFYATKGEPIFCRSVCKVNAFNKKKDYSDAEALYRKCPIDPVWIRFMVEKLKHRAGVYDNLENKLFFIKDRLEDIKSTLNFPPINKYDERYLFYIIQLIQRLDKEYQKKYKVNLGIGYSQFFEDRKNYRVSKKH